MKVYVTKRFTFEAAHKLIGYEGACANVHGHSYKLEVTLSGDLFDTKEINEWCSPANECMVTDFKDLKKIVDVNIISTHDHSFLNTIYSNPTAECMVIGMFKLLSACIPKDTKLESVKLWETEDSFAEYKGE